MDSIMTTAEFYQLSSSQHDSSAFVKIVKEIYDPLCFLFVSQRGLNLSGFTVRWNITRKRESMLDFINVRFYFFMIFYVVGYQKAS